MSVDDQKRVTCRYVRQSAQKIEEHSDADREACVKTRESTSGGCIMWGGHLVKPWSPTQPKPLHLAGGYEQLRYYAINGSPSPAKDRSVRVDIRKI